MNAAEIEVRRARALRALDAAIYAATDSLADLPDVTRELDAATRKLDRVRALTETTDSPGWVRAGDLLDALEV